MSKPTLLIIEDDDLQYEIYAEALADYNLVRATTASKGLELAGKQAPDAILLDHVLDHGEQGLNFLPELKELLPFVPVIIVSGALEAHQQLQALQGSRRAHYLVTKPVDLSELQKKVGDALKECGEHEVVRTFEALERSKRIDKDELMSRSADRLVRQATIRQQLEGRSKERPNISALARQFNVARRTIIRDLKELIRRGELPPEIYPEWDQPDDDER